MKTALKNRLFAALGVSSIGGLALAQPSRPDAAPARPSSWTVDYALGGSHPTWCSRGNARCEATGPTCAPSIRVEQGCSPGTACRDARALTDAPLLQDVSQAQRARDPRACCYALPLHCVPPWAGRTLSDGRGEPVTTPVCSRADWGARADRDGGEGAARPGAWALLGAREHAAVASFAQTALRLLRFGAPAALVEDTLRAALEEVSHARACFARAEREGEGSVGPGALDTSLEPAHDTMLRFALDTLREGCVAETLGAFDAAERAMRARSEGDRAHWAMIADEEARHAELAWRTLRWALVSRGDAEVLRESLRAERAQIALRASVCGGGSGCDDATNAVVLPCLDALLGA